MIHRQRGGERGRARPRDQPAAQSHRRRQVRPKKKIAARRVRRKGRERHPAQLHVIDARAREGEIDLGVIGLDRRRHRLRAVDRARQRRIAVRRAVRVGDDVGMIIRVEDERRAVPGVKPGHRVQLKVPLAGVLRVETKDAAEGGAIAVQSLDVIQLCRGRVDDLANDRRPAGVIAARTRARAIHPHVRVDVAVVRDAGVRENVLPRTGAVSRVLGIGQGRDRDRVRFPEQRHLRHLGAGKRDRSIGACRQNHAGKTKRCEKKTACRHCDHWWSGCCRQWG